MAQSLYEFLNQCTVKLSLPGGAAGTGFFVAPGLIVTCAHVVAAAQRAQAPIEVSWNKQAGAARIEEFRDAPYPDLALLRVELANHPCVLLHGGAEPFRDLYSFGYPDNESAGASTTFRCEGWAGNEHEQLKFQQGQVRPGMSGSPVLNNETGSVCGIIQLTRDRSSDLGGKALLSQVVLREFPELEDLQRRFHQQDTRWMERLTRQQRGQLGLEWLPKSAAIKIFYSYDPKDEALRSELAKQLKVLKRTGLIADWYADNTNAGMEYKQEAMAHLDAAHIILLLISPDFIASDYCYDEQMTRAMERFVAGEARVIPILLRPTDNLDSTPFGKLQPVPRNRKPVTSWRSTDEAFFEVAKEIRVVVEALKTQNS